MNNKMIVALNSTQSDNPIAINQELSIDFPIMAERLYLGNLISQPEVRTESIILPPTTSTTQAPTTSTTGTTSTTTSTSSSVAPATSTQPVVEPATQPPQDLATASTAPIISRQRRQE